MKKFNKNNECIKVAVRCRPLKEIEKNNTSEEIIEIIENNSEIILKNSNQLNNTPNKFAFDFVFGKESKQENIYEKCSKPIIDCVLEGYNGTIFAYGQTGTGKTFTMEGNENNLGIIPRAIKSIFNKIKDIEKDTQYLIRTSMIELYNEKIIDSLSEKNNYFLNIHENNNKEFYVKGWTTKTVKNYNELYKLFEIGKNKRQVRATKSSDYSSRSHSIFSIIIESMKPDLNGENETKIGKLNLVDLAGSEKINKTKTSGIGKLEGIKINLSLTILGKVINKWVKNESHIPFRDSILTKLLRESLWGNTKTIMFANIAPTMMDYSETFQTLKYANNVKNIKISPIVNINNKDGLILERINELEFLKKQLELFNKDGKININFLNLNNNNKEQEDIINNEKKIWNLNKDNENIIQENQNLKKNLDLNKQYINEEKNNTFLLQKKLNKLNNNIIGNNFYEEINESLKEAQIKLNEELEKEKNIKTEYLLEKNSLKENKKDRDIFDNKTKNLQNEIFKINFNLENQKQEIIDFKINNKFKLKEKNKKVDKLNKKINSINEKLSFQNYLINKFVCNNFIKKIENIIHHKYKKKELNNIFKEPFSFNSLKRPCIINKNNYNHYYFNLDIYYYHDNINNKLIRLDNDMEEETDYIF